MRTAPSSAALAGVFLVSLAACERRPSAFAFTLSGAIDEPVQSAADAHGSVDNGGFVAIDDAGWGLRISLGTLAPGARTLSKGRGALLVVAKRSGEVYSSDLGTSCTVWIDPHESTNGSAVSGVFTCDGLRSTAGGQVSVQAGRFTTFVSDAANDPTSQAPPNGPPV